MLEPDAPSTARHEGNHDTGHQHVACLSVLLPTVSAALAAIRDDAARERAWAEQYEAT